MQFRVFVPYRDNKLYRPLQEVLGVTENIGVLISPQNNENLRDCIVADITTNFCNLQNLSSRYISHFLKNLEVPVYDEAVIFDKGRFRFVAALDMNDEMVIPVRGRLGELGHGSLFYAKYPVSNGKKDSLGRMILLEGEGVPDFLRSCVERALLDLYGSRYAVSEEVQICDF